MGTMRQVWIGALVVVLAACGAASALAQRPSPTDDQIQSQIEARLFDKGLVTVTVAVQDGHVTLSGRVEDLASKSEAIKQARKVKGVKDVASDLTVREPESNADVARAIGDVLQASSYLTVFDEVGGRVADGVATLTGFVTTPDKAKRVGEAVSAVAGVQQVVNQIEVLPASTFDDEIRAGVADRIYNAPALSQYAYRPPYPIRIIVKNGHVALFGVVVSDMDRRMAEVLARGVFGVHGVDNQLQVEG